MIVLGLDIGSNSVGSAWIDTEKMSIQLGVSVFPAGVDEQENKRGEPKNKARRQTRSQRRTIHRRAERKRRLTALLVEVGLLPQEPDEFRKLLDANQWPVPTLEKQYKQLLKSGYTVWHLRRDALKRKLHPYEFGRTILHLAQHRGAVGVETDPDDPDEGKVRKGMDRLEALMNDRGAAPAETVGQFLADLLDERRHSKNGVTWNGPIRNRQYRIPEEDMLFAGRELLRREFLLIVARQQAFKDAPLAAMLTDDLLKKLDDPTQTDTWRHQGELYGQRRTYWDTGTLGRCDLEPTERCVPIADMHAQEFRVIETVNNIRLTKRGEPERALDSQERQKVIDVLRKQKTGSVATVRKALNIHKKAVKEFYTLNIERDEKRDINTDWFYREIVHGVFTEARWISLDEQQKESVNRALLKFDPHNDQHDKKLHKGARAWWGLDDGAADRLIQTWKKDRPKIDQRLKLSRSAIQNLLPYMNVFDQINQRWPTQIEARVRFAEDRTNAANHDQRVRYDLGVKPLSKRDREYLRKHDEPLPPAPMLANPVVRKAVHEVRRQIIAWWRKFGRTPDRIVVEYVRSATQPGIVRDATIARNRKRESIRKNIIQQFELTALAPNQQNRAVDRILLCRQQRGLCAYTGDSISEKTAADGTDLDIDHIVPMSRSQDNGFNNKMLVLRTANRGKGNQTVEEWMTAEQFAAMEQRLAHLEKGASSDDYFTKKDYGRKWENLHRDAPKTTEFLASQLTDTAYASKQVGQWLREVLYDGESDGKRCVLTTKGSYTSILRKDWGLSESDLDRKWHDNLEPDEREGDNRSGRVRKQKNKDRADHLHHAIDAVCIALTSPERIKDLARFAEEQENARAKLGYWARRKALPPPWPKCPAQPTESELHAATAAFREQVLASADKLIVSHRPVKRRLVGAFHEATHYGPVIAPLPPHRTEQADRLFTNRICADGLKPSHLRVPNAWDKLSNSLEDINRPKADQRAIRRLLAALPDPSPGKSGIVRDRALRDRIRKCLRANDLNPDDFTGNQIKLLLREGKLTMKSGVPIKGVVLLRTNTDPVIIPRKLKDPTTGKMVPHMDPDDKEKPHPRTKRVYIGGNNHHVPIRENRNTGKWSGTVVSTFDAAKRVRLQGHDAVDRNETEDSAFIMSLAEGEMIYARRWDPNKKEASGRAEYFVLCKLDKSGASCRIHFAPHWDARKASEQDRWAVTPGDLRKCGPDPATPPYKVWVSPLGDVRRLEKD